MSACVERRPSLRRQTLPSVPIIPDGCTVYEDRVNNSTMRRRLGLWDLRWVWVYPGPKVAKISCGDRNSYVREGGGEGGAAEGRAVVAPPPGERARGGGQGPKGGVPHGSDTVVSTEYRLQCTCVHPASATHLQLHLQ